MLEGVFTARILLDDCIALVVDYQEKLMPIIYENAYVINNSERLINGFNVLEMPIIVTQQYPNGLGKTIAQIENLTQRAKCFDKTDFSCYMDYNIREHIKSLGKHTVILCGIESHICILQTAIDLMAAGYNVVVVEDCIGSRSKVNRDIAIKRVISEGAIIASAESLLFELISSATHSNFKNISSIFR